MEKLIEQVRKGHRRAIARLITRVERNSESARIAVKALYGETGQAHIVGITGPPGSGKSTLVNELTKAIRKLDLAVGIVAVDPSTLAELLSEHAVPRDDLQVPILGRGIAR